MQCKDAQLDNAAMKAITQHQNILLNIIKEWIGELTEQCEIEINHTVILSSLANTVNNWQPKLSYNW